MHHDDRIEAIFPTEMGIKSAPYLHQKSTKWALRVVQFRQIFFYENLKGTIKILALKCTTV